MEKTINLNYEIIESLCKDYGISESNVERDEIINGNLLRLYIKKNENVCQNIYLYDLTHLDMSKYKAGDIHTSFEVGDLVIFLFDTWEDYHAVENDIILDDGIEHRAITNDYFNQVTLEYDKQIENFLMYKKNSKENDNRCMVFNISLESMLNLYNKMGIRLFDYNVRFFITRNESEIESSFKKYIYNYIERFDCKQNEIKTKILELKYLSNSKECQDFMPSVFWLCHNGITIATKKMKIKSNRIELNVGNTYVLNGCQSIVTFDKIISHITDGLRKVLKKEKKSEEEKKENLEVLDSIISGFKKSIIFKVTIIEEEKTSKIKNYSIGLNTQKPIVELDVLASSDDAKEINRLLYSFSILKPGDDVDNNKIKINILSFIKCYLNSIFKPELSKNFDKNNSKKKLKEIVGEIALDKSTADSNLLISYNSQINFKKFSKQYFDSLSSNDKATIEYSNKICILANGSNYFASYCVFKKKKIDEINFETFSEFIDEIVNYCKSTEVERKLVVDDFKNTGTSLFNSIFISDKIGETNDSD